METRIQQDNDLLLIIINENLTSGSITELIQWNPSDAETMPGRVIVDLRNVAALDSSGLSALVRLNKILKPMTSQIFYCPSDVVQKVFHETNLDQVWITYPDVVSATAALEKQPNPWLPFRIQAA
jgi:anti-anti-sigma factor